MALTRNNSVDKVFGFSKPFDFNVLPTYKDVFLAYEYLKMKSSSDGLEVSRLHLIKDISSQLESIWKRASIPSIIGKQSLINKVSRCITKAQDLKKYAMDKYSQQYFISKRQEFDHLFDIASCTCFQKKKSRNDCSCPEKIPKSEWDFYIDQNTERKMIISLSIDKKLSARVQSKQNRASKIQLQYNKEAERSQNQQSLIDTSLDVFEDNFEENYNDEDFSVLYMKKTTSQRNYYSYSKTAQMADRLGISNSAVAALHNAILSDLDLLKEETTLDCTKIGRARKKFREEAINSHLSDKIKEGIKCIAFDGRKDFTNIHVENVYGRMRQQKVKEEHITLIEEPESFYLDHLTPTSGSAQDIASEILSFIKLSNSFETLEVLCCDGTNVNVGSKNGIIHLVELFLRRPVQWNICMLHQNELPFRKLFESYFGNTSGPNTFSGEINVIGSNIEKLPLTKFKKINGKVEDINESVKKNLSSDQSYMLEISLAVQNGPEFFPPSLISKKPGGLHQARWLTRACRILRYYVSCKKPSNNLIKMVKFILCVYVPSWFNIKQNCLITDGPSNLFFQIKLINYMKEKKDKEIVEQNIQRNAFFAHPENVLVAGIVDLNKQIRLDAVQRIIKARKDKENQVGTRIFKPPRINFSAAHYYEMIDWDNETVTPPPILESFTDDDLLKAIDHPLPISKIPCHTQSVERCVQLVTRASEKVFGYNARHGYIIQTLKSRKNMPKIITKQDYTSLRNN